MCCCRILQALTESKSLPLFSKCSFSLFWFSIAENIINVKYVNTVYDIFIYSLVGLSLLRPQIIKNS